MSLIRYDFNYQEALNWTEHVTATLTNVPVVRSSAEQKVESAEETRKQIRKDLTRTCFFPKSAQSEIVNRFYRGWTRINHPFCFTQGDMEGGGFLKTVWNAFGIKRESMEEMKSEEIRFGYINDIGIRCGVTFLYSPSYPSKWMLSILKNGDKDSLRDRSVSFFLSGYFNDDFKDDKNQHKKADNIKSMLEAFGSEAVRLEFSEFFYGRGHLEDYDVVTNFEKSKTRHMGENPMLAEPSKKYISPRRLSQSPPALPILAGGTGGAATGFVLGMYVIGPLLAVPTFGLSLVVAPIVCTLLGMLIGGLVAGYACSPDQPAAEIEDPLEPAAVDVVARGSSNGRMAGRGLQPGPTDDPKKRQDPRGTLTLSSTSPPSPVSPIAPSLRLGQQVS